VHPDDAYAAAHDAAAGGRGKTEMWHVVLAKPGAQVLVGLKSNVNKDEFLEAVKTHTLEKLFEAYAANPGDTFFVPAGTPHTIGPGMVICEVQEYSDLTYRIYDYGRVDGQGHPRALHLEKALGVIKFGVPYGGQTPALALPANGFKKDLLAACSYFVTERWELIGPTEFFTNSEHFNILIFLSGRGKIVAEGKEVVRVSVVHAERAFEKQAPNSACHQGGLVELVADLDVVRQDGLETRQVGFDGLDDRKRRGIGSFGHGDVDRAASIYQRVAGLDVGAVLDRSDVAYEDRLRSARTDGNVA